MVIINLSFCLKYIRFLQVCVVINAYEGTMAGCGKTEMMAFMQVSS